MQKENMEVLLVEDNPDHAEMVIRSFREHRFECNIHHVSDGALALDYLFNKGDYTDPLQNPRPQVVLLDLRLPKIDGLEVLRTIKTTDDLKRIPVIVLTTSEAEKDLGKAYDGYANSYLVKPVNFETFVGLMQNIGFYWLVNNHPA